MILMEKDGQKKFVFDCFIPWYRADGWKAEGEADSVQLSPEAPPEQAVDETAVSDGTTEETDAEPEQAVDETAAGQTYTCPHCGKEYSKEASLKTHIRRNHTEE